MYIPALTVVVWRDDAQASFALAVLGACISSFVHQVSSDNIRPALHNML